MGLAADRAGGNDLARERPVHCLLRQGVDFRRTETHVGQHLKLLDDALWKGIVIKQRNGQQVYGGLQEGSTSSPLILPSETRTVAEALRAVSTERGLSMFCKK